MDEHRIQLTPGRQYNCPNCAAPLTGGDICPYCGTRIEWIPMVACNISVRPKKVVPIISDYRVTREEYKNMGSGRYDDICMERVKSELGCYATRYAKLKKVFVPELNHIVYRGELLIGVDAGGAIDE